MANFKLRYRANKHQKEFAADREHFLLHLSTGFGGGKTYALAMKAIELSYINRGFHGGMIGPDLKDLKRDLIPELISICKRNHVKFKYHKTEGYFQFPWSGDGKLFIVSGMDEIRGPNWAYAIINEVTLIPLVRYKEIIGRVRVKRAPLLQVASAGTPEGFASEYYDYFIEKPPKSLRVIYGATDDNLENLNDAYLEILQDTFDEKMLEAYRHGLWVNMTGSRFYYSYLPQRNEDKNTAADDGVEFHCSMDFNVDPMCAAFWQLNGDQLVGVDEIELAGNDGYRTENMVEAMIKRGYTPANTIVYPDPSGRKRSTQGDPDNKILEKAGYRVRVKTVAPSFRRRQLNVNNLFEKSRIIVNPIKQPCVSRDFKAVEQDKVTLEKLKKNPRLTHFSDGVDYMTDVLFPSSGNIAQVREQKLR